MNVQRPIRFFHRGRIVELADMLPTRTVLEWLREDARCTGTKEGCAEGDCGACTVVVGRLDGEGALALEAVNACIRFVATLDGKALFAVEDVAAPDGTLHPVQQALVDHHGSQCGFCTPGFVMSLWACYERHRAAETRPTRQALADELAGNLCRCTGYRPILDAGEAMFEAPPARFDAEPVRAALAALAGDPPLAVGEAFAAPRTLDEFAALRAAEPEALVVAGATDIGLWVTKQLRTLPKLVSIGEVAELRTIGEACDADGRRWLSIGAGASLEAAWRSLHERWPVLEELWLRFASPPIRHAGTLGGNVANGSPIGDGAPVLIALGARLVLRRAERLRRLPLDAFYLDYLKNALEPGEFVQAIEVPLPGVAQRLRAYKVAKRFDSDISAVCAGLALELDGETIVDARLAYGGMAATVRRAAAAEAALRGRRWDEAALAEASAALASDFRPITDMRASAGYRMQVAQNLLRRFWLETRPVDPLPAAALSVWSRERAAPEPA